MIMEALSVFPVEARVTLDHQMVITRAAVADGSDRNHGGKAFP